MSAEHDIGGRHRQENDFAGARETTEELMRQITEAHELAAQNQPAADEIELAGHIRQARMELNNESEDTVILLSASETARDLHDRRLADDVYMSLAGAYGTRGDIAGGLDAVNQIQEHVLRLEGLVRLSEITGDESVKRQLAEAVENKAGHAVHVEVAREVFYKFRMEDRDLDKAQNFSKLVAKSAENASNYPKAVDTNARVALMAIIEPDSPQPSLDAQAKTLVDQANLTADPLKYLDQYWKQAQDQPPGPDQEKMLATYTIATVELANDALRPDQAAA